MVGDQLERTSERNRSASETVDQYLARAMDRLALDDPVQEVIRAHQKELH